MRGLEDEACVVLTLNKTPGQFLDPVLSSHLGSDADCKCWLWRLFVEALPLERLLSCFRCWFNLSSKPCSQRIDLWSTPLRFQTPYHLTFLDNEECFSGLVVGTSTGD